MEKKKLAKGRNIPTSLPGGFYYISSESSNEAAQATLKKLGKKKGKTKVVRYELTKEKSFLDWLFGVKPETEFTYVAYVKS